MAPHSSTFAWKIPWTEEPGRLQSMESLELDTTERLHFHFSLSCIGEGNGNPLQCSCLENPRDGEAWWAAVYGVAQSRTQLKWLSSSSCLKVYRPRFLGPKWIFLSWVYCFFYPLTLLNIFSNSAFYKRLGNSIWGILIVANIPLEILLKSWQKCTAVVF